MRRTVTNLPVPPISLSLCLSVSLSLSLSLSLNSGTGSQDRKDESGEQRGSRSEEKASEKLQLNFNKSSPVQGKMLYL
jgi:hypothetical protein